jgi:Flp pilus assembly protein TadG
MHGAIGFMTRTGLGSRLRDERGSVLVLVAAAMTVLLGCGALVLDLGNTRQTARNEQNAADAGALAGAVGLPLSAAPPTGTAFQSAAYYAFQTLLGQSATKIACPSSGEQPPGATECYQPTAGTQGTIAYVTTPWGPDQVADGTISAPADNQIHVKVCSDVQTGLAGIFGVGDLRPCREATAINTLSSALPFALGAMAASGQGTFKLSGGGRITVDGNVVVNSNTDTTALCDAALMLEGGGGILSATAIEVRDPPGTPVGWEACGPGSFSPQPSNTFSNPPLSDPLCPNPNDPSLPCLPYPADPGCPPPANCNSTTVWAPGDTVWPGVYDRITVKSGTLTMMPGLYVFRGPGSRFEIDGGTVVGNGVTLFFGCQDYPSTCRANERGSYLSMGANPEPCEEPPGSRPPCTPPPPATATFRAPPPGSYPDDRIPGMAIFFDRNNTSAPTDVTPGIGIWGDATLNVTGTIYAASAFFRMVSGGNPDLRSSVIVNTFEHSGSGNLRVTYTEDENVEVTGGIALIS